MLGNRKDIEVVSAGVHAVRGQPPSLYAVQVCEEEGADISGQRSQPLTATLVDRATHIFAMTGAHVETIQTLFPQSADKTFLFREFEEPGTTVWRDVPDPIGLGREVYEDCAHIITECPTQRAGICRTERTGAAWCNALARAIFVSHGGSSSAN